MKLLRLALPALVAAALLGGAGHGLAQKKTAIGSFAVLSTAEADKAQADAQAWLKSVGKTDAATTQKFQAIWGQSNRTVLDKVTETLRLGDATAAQMLAAAANPQAAAPMGVPAIFNDKNAAPYLKNNLALAYARLLTQRRVFEQALEVLNT